MGLHTPQKSVVGSTPVLPERAVRLCKEAFSRFGEVWLIGPKGDHHYSLVTMGILEDRHTSIALAHVHSTLGLRCARMIEPPRNSSVHIEGIATQLSPLVEGHVARVAADLEAKVCVLMPHPNAAFENVLREYGVEDRFTTTSPAKNVDQYFALESKMATALLVDELAERFPDQQHLRIPYTLIRDTPATFEEYRQLFGLALGEGVCLQRDLSVSGDGTRLVRSQAEMDILFQDRDWRQWAKERRMKVSKEIAHAYPANGSACVVPLPSGGCRVVVDPLSHKPMGPGHSSLGNDWSVVWPDEVTRQYLRSAELLGRMLHEKYGYTGLFGPDYLVERLADGTQRLRLTEINPRWQGTTPHQTSGALASGRVPLELIHYLIKLGERATSEEVLSLIGDADAYNEASVRSVGGFYVKIMGPQRPLVVRRDLNGEYLFDGSSCLPVSEAPEVCTVESSVRITIKGPSKGDTVGHGVVPIGYIAGRGGEPVFSPTTPGFTPYGGRLYDAVVRLIYAD